MIIPRNNPASRRDQRQPDDDGKRRADGGNAFLDSEWDEFGGGYDVTPPRSSIAFPQRCAGAE